MSAYVKFETPKEVAAKALEVISVAKDTGKIRKGTNEATKAIESGKAKLVVIAADVSPEEVVMHLPGLCAEKKIAYIYVPTREELGKAAGLGVSTSAIAVEKAGNAAEIMRDVVEKTAGLRGDIPEAHAKEEKGEKPKEERKPAAKPKESKEEEAEKKRARKPKKAKEEKPEKKEPPKEEKPPEKKE